MQSTLSYADDFTIWLSGPPELALSLKNQVSHFLDSNLTLTLSPEKTFITNPLKDKIRFLGFEIYINKNPKTIRDINNNLRNVLKSFALYKCAKHT